jgi:cobalt-zinc-cadmium efflux system membrane fusion protein
MNIPMMNQSKNKTLQLSLIVAASIVLGSGGMYMVYPYIENVSRQDPHTHRDATENKREEVHTDIITMTEAQIQSAGIEIAEAAPQRIRTTLQLSGEIRLNEDRVAHVVPRLAGVVEQVYVTVGQSVKQGQVLAVIASPAVADQRSELQLAQQRLALATMTYEREKQLWLQKISAEQDYLQAKQSQAEAQLAVRTAQQKLAALGMSATSGGGVGRLNQVELRAPFDGMVTERHLSLGEAVKEDVTVFTVADLRQLWAEINVPAKDIGFITVGDTVMLTANRLDMPTEDGAANAATNAATNAANAVKGKVALVSAVMGEQTRMAKVRVVLNQPVNQSVHSAASPSSAGIWRPGLFVTMTLTTGLIELPVAVASEAIQTLDEKTVVFVKTAEGFKPQPVTIGRSDGQWVEVDQLTAGTPYVAKQSFILKAELGKGSAEHSH